MAIRAHLMSGYSIVVMPQPSKLVRRVRFPLPAPFHSAGAKNFSNAEKAPQFGRRRFYANAWCFIMDATHADMPLAETARTRNRLSLTANVHQSVLA